MASEPNRYLIAVGSPDSPGLRFLPNVKRDVERISDLLCDPSQGYERILAKSIPFGAKASSIRDAILDWFTHGQRRFDDLVILYFAGHGGNAGLAGNYFLFTSDTDDNRPSDTAINVGRFVQDLYDGKGERPQSLLLILDACYSGKGGAEAIAQTAAIEQKGAFRDGAGLWVVATADSFSQAEDGAFLDAVTNVFEDPAFVPAGGAEYLNPVDIFVYGTNDWLGEHDHLQQAEWKVVGNRRRPQFLRNPRFTTKLDGVSLLDESHWDPKARGVDDSASAGWFFTGRRTALETLVSWLNSPSSDQKARVVTGLPGSGKSAVLARLVTCANPSRRAEMSKERVLDVSDLTVPAEGSINAYVHARNLPTADIAKSIAKQLGIETRSVEDIVGAVANRKKVSSIIVDALDEAQEPREVEFLLLRKLASEPAVRLIVGTRKQGDYVPLAGKNEVIDLDDPNYFARADIVGYVFNRLTAKNSASPYVHPSENANARKIAELVADRAGFSFLFARILARKLASAPAPIDTSVEGWTAKVSVPTDLREVFALDLSRFSGEDRKKFIDLLVPIAWARGKGLPQKTLWASLASAIAGRRYANSAIENLKQVAGYYLVQDTDKGEVVYRLFHEAFAEYLRAESEERKPEKRFTSVLESSAGQSSTGKMLWSKIIDQYTLDYLPAHAAAAGELDRLLADALFLLTFSPESLLPHFRSLRSTAAVAIARCYRSVAHHLRNSDLASKVSYLLLSAIQHGAEDIVGPLRVLARELDPPWNVVWAAWAPNTPNEVAAEGDQDITAFTFVEDHKTESFVVGLGDYVAVFDAFSARELVRSKPLDFKIQFLTCVKVGGSAWIVVGGEDRNHSRSASLAVLRYPSCELEAVQRAAHSGLFAISAMCGIEQEHEALVATAGEDLTVRLWEVPGLRLVSEAERADAAPVSGMISVRRANQPVLVCGGDAVSSDGVRSPDGAPIFLLRVHDLTRLATLTEGSTGYVKHMVPLTLDGFSYVLAKVEHEGLKLLGLNEAKFVATTKTTLDVFGSMPQSDSSVLIFGEEYGQLRTLEVRSSLDGGDYHVNFLPPSPGVEVNGTGWQGPLRIGSRNIIACADGQQLRLWDVEDLLAVPSPSLSKEVLAAATSACIAASTYVVTAGREGTITIRDGETGNQLSSYRLERIPYNEPKAVAATFLGGKPILAVGTVKGMLYLFDMMSGTLLDTFQPGKRIEALAICQMDDSTLLFAATDLKDDFSENRYAIATWDLGTGVERHWNDRDVLEARGRRLTLSGYQDKSLNCVAVAQGRDRTILYAAGPFSFVRAWSLRGNKVENFGDHWIQPPRPTEYVTALATGMLDDRTVVAAGNDGGILAVWDATTRDEIAQIHQVDKRGITAIAFLNDNRGLISAGRGGLIKLWSTEIKPVGQIDIQHRILSLSMLGTTGNRVAVATELGLFILDLKI